MRKLLLSLSLVMVMSVPFGLRAKEVTHAVPDENISTEFNTRIIRVLEVNQAKHSLIGETGIGTKIEITVDPAKVKNFSQLKKGDMIKVQTMKSFAITLSKAQPGEKPSDEVVTATETASPGQKPGMTKEEVRKITAELTKIDTDKDMFELKGPAGNTVELKAKNPANLKGLKKGDMVTATYTREVAVSVIPAPATPAK